MYINQFKGHSKFQLLYKQDRYGNDFDNNLLLRKRFKIEQKVINKKEEEDQKPKNFVLPIAQTR